ncbi:hypothetical protein C8J57DRAFT_1480062 [Mycena rebaudengoi]|nr:hypothetical protein C8J57DRAFT_1480062 [Mycena rebaudengoi]
MQLQGTRHSKKTTIISAFRKCGIWPLDESVIPDAAFEPARNYTTQASMPVAPRIPSILVPVATSDSESSTPSTAAASNTTSITSSNTLVCTSTYSAGMTNASLVSQPRPSTPIASMPPAAHEALRAAYTIAMPSPLRKTASRKALAARNDELRNLLKVAGIELDKNVAQMALMQRENTNIRQQLHAKKNKQKRTYTTGQARLMTSAGMHTALLQELQKKQMGELHSELKTIFPGIRKAISESEKAPKAAKKQQEREAKAAQKAIERAAKEAARVRGRGQRGARGHGGRGSRGRGRGQGRAWDGDSEDEFDPESGEEPDLHEQLIEADAPSSDEEIDGGEPFISADDGPSSNNALPDESDDDNESGEEGTRIESFNGHRWESRRNLQFQVLWADRDVTWEPLENVNDCAAMKNYLTHHNVDDPLLLPKRKFLINTLLKASD